MANEKRLIDADALYEELSTLSVMVTWLRAGKGVLNEFMKQYRESVLRIVDEQPTVDAVEVVHGRWVDDHDDPRYICEECGKWLLIDDGTAEMNYCPNCGADMRERKDND